MAKRITVVLSQGQSLNPAKRGLEEDVVTALLMEHGIDVTVIPHLYDLKPDGTGMLALQGIAGDMVVLSWLFRRAAHWTLDRNGIHGRFGTVLLKSSEEEQAEADAAEEAAEAGGDEEEKPRVLDEREQPKRTIYCLDLRASERADDFVNEIKRIGAETSTQVVGLMDWVGGSPQPEQLQRFQNPTNNTALDAAGRPTDLAATLSTVAAPAADTGAEVPSTDDPAPADAVRVAEDTSRRWYPVIDFSRCTNCMECIDFCLFGVYGVDVAETILVEQPDNCRKGCPACSRVCPENAIIFPQHKSAAIAGAPTATGGLKIDLSRLFGGDPGEDAVTIAARERDEQLMLAGRDAVGLSVGIPKRQSGKAEEPKDDLDDLIDALDDLDI